MNKFGKRIQKFIGDLDNCVVIGQGFGHLPNIVEMFHTVFLISDKVPEFKAKNLIYRENFEDLLYLTGITVVFFDLDQIDKFRITLPLWYNQKSHIIVEGNNIIDRDQAKEIFGHGYRAVEMQGTHHIWKIQK